jgi:hypothetical protein
LEEETVEENENKSEGSTTMDASRQNESRPPFIIVPDGRIPTSGAATCQSIRFFLVACGKERQVTVDFSDPHATDAQVHSFLKTIADDMVGPREEVVRIIIAISNSVPGFYVLSEASTALSLLRKYLPSHVYVETNRSRDIQEGSSPSPAWLRSLLVSLADVKRMGIAKSSED